MRIDTRLNRQGLSDRQLFFIECWGSQCHRESIDTDRVSFNNVLNALQELMFLYKFDAKFNAVDKRKRATTELFELLETDVVLQSDKFQSIPQQLFALLKDKSVIGDSGRSPVENKSKLMESLFRQLIDCLQQEYVPELLVLLQAELDKAEPPSDEEYTAIAHLSNSLMSFLLTLGMPLAEFYLLYSRILLGKDKPEFSSRYSSWAEKLTSPISSYTVTLTIDNDKLHDLLIASTPPLIFNGCTFNPYTTIKGKKTTSIDINTKAISVLAARTKADHILMESLDVVAYILGNSHVTLQNAFKVVDEKGIITEIQNFENDILVNSDRLTINEFSSFINSLSTLYTNATSESVKKISSAFHFLRNGITSNSKESRFTSYWSAIESLTHGVSPESMSQDAHVIYSVVPCMGLDYVVKQLFALRGIIRFLKLGPFTDGQNPVDLENKNLGELYQHLKNENITQTLKTGLQNYPYAQFVLRKLIGLANDPAKMAEKIVLHSEKVTLHIHRLYILRNSIVHNAESSPHIDLLTANLEHYLRGTINAMFYTASMLPVVRSPEETFIRYQYLYETILKELEPTHGAKDNKKAAIRALIAQNTIIRSDNALIAWLKLHQ
ncbi:hypothetical protein ACQIBV_004704 [Yersinia enterocolitica]|uniref:hypothetical protein n=1 Tax=Yersinia enterocolitica TaxID=630 RepID=UPI0028649FCA|nr:hypothetical protein [Yersinia enterocolitica]EKN3502475.1 hypothetical protein [Yersinia enterocolitica]EKN3638084.1 hypothetical protein [Yersinia enterocolitica]EKN3689911.1 hypothetical protein [Yersinia enterocolitica]EKN3833549.1 hypothetical protein [Yersinia enterocolitica]